MSVCVYRLIYILTTHIFIYTITNPIGTSWAVPKYDALVTVSMRFLASLAAKRMHYDLFNNPTL